MRGRPPGTHDFTAFTPTQTYHRRFERRRPRAHWTRYGDVLTFEIEADSFMRNMNRILVGTMLEVAQGRLDDFAKLLEGAPAKRRRQHRAATRALPRRGRRCPS